MTVSTTGRADGVPLYVYLKRKLPFSPQSTPQGTDGFLPPEKDFDEVQAFVEVSLSADEALPDWGAIVLVAERKGVGSKGSQGRLEEEFGCAQERKFRRDSRVLSKHLGSSLRNIQDLWRCRLQKRETRSKKMGSKLERYTAVDDILQKKMLMTKPQTLLY